MLDSIIDNLGSLKQQLLDINNDIITSSSIPAAKYRDDMLWQTWLNIKDNPTCYSSASIDDFMSYFNTTIGSDTPVRRCKAMVTSIDRDLIESKTERGLVVVTSYVNEPNKKARQKLLEAIKLNSTHPQVDHVVLFVDTSEESTTLEQLEQLQIDCKNMYVVPSSEITYQHMQQALVETVTEDVNMVLINPGCYLDGQSQILKYVELNRRVLCMNTQQSKYWQHDAIVVNNTWLKQSHDPVMFGTPMGMEQHLHGLHENYVTCLNISAGGYTYVRRTTDKLYHNTTPVSCNTQELEPGQVTYDNFTNGCTTKWNPGNIYHPDRLSGDLGPYFMTDINMLFREHDTQLCLMLMTCSKQIHTGETYPAIKKFITLNASKTRSFDMHVCVDQREPQLKENIQSIITQQAPGLINQLYIHDINIPKQDNMFTYDTTDIKRLKKPPRLGTTHGANQLFYDGIHRVMEHKQGYGNILMIEPDCQPITEGWFDKCVARCEHDKRFLIAGSVYKGTDDRHRNKHHATHINGVAIYRNAPETRELLHEGEQLIQEHVHTNQDTSYLNFDVANCKYATEFLPPGRVIDVDIISNYSVSSDANVSIPQVIKRHPNTVILHKKFS